MSDGITEQPNAEDIKKQQPVVKPGIVNEQPKIIKSGFDKNKKLLAMVSIALVALVGGAVTLSIDSGVLSWTVGGTAPHGLKVIMNTTGNPVYPGNSIEYIEAGTATYSLPDKTADTYKVRACKYTADSNINGGCTDYSNEVNYTVSP